MVQRFATGSRLKLGNDVDRELVELNQRADETVGKVRAMLEWPDLLFQQVRN
jgi:hypothetical protein